MSECEDYEGLIDTYEHAQDNMNTGRLHANDSVSRAIYAANEMRFYTRKKELELIKNKGVTI